MARLADCRVVDEKEKAESLRLFNVEGSILQWDSINACDSCASSMMGKMIDGSEEDD